MHTSAWHGAGATHRLRAAPPAQDSSSKLPGVLYGRYPGDNYAGGNPWVLTSAALAQLLYRVAAHAKTAPISDNSTVTAWAEALNVQPTPATLPSALFAAGDAVLARLRAHVKADGFRLDEQIDKRSGKQTSAHSLTWSYAEVFNALHWRAQATEALLRVGSRGVAVNGTVEAA